MSNTVDRYLKKKSAETDDKELKNRILDLIEDDEATLASITRPKSSFKSANKRMSSIENALEIKEQYDDGYVGTIDESGAGMSRVIKMLDDGGDFIMITASRGDKSRKENQKNNNDLIRYIRQELGMKTGAYKLVGHWKECSEVLGDGETIADCGGDIVDTLEESWLIIKPNNVSSDDFLDMANKAAKKYHQDAYVIRKEGKLTLNSKNGDVWGDLGRAGRESLSTGFRKIMGLQGYTELKKTRDSGRIQNIVFEGVYLSVPKNSNFSRMMFKEMNILY